MLRTPRNRPGPWQEHRQNLRPWALVFGKLEWYFEWAAWALGNWAFLEVLEYLSTFSVLIAVIFYFSESGDRIKQKHYQAWQVINTAQGKGGSGGRIEALQELNHDRVPLIGVDASSAFLQGIQLDNAKMSRCQLGAADIRDGFLRGANLAYCNLQSANLRGSHLEGANLEDADLSNADLSGSFLARARLARADLSNADLRGADLSGLQWKGIRSLRLTNIYGVLNPPDGFVAYALSQGAVSLQSDEEWERLQSAH